MSWLKSHPSTRRRGARNFTHKTANKRIKEGLQPHRENIRNALKVNAAEAMIYKAIDSGIPCSCRKTIGVEALTKDHEVNPNAYSSKIDSPDLFGENEYEVDSSMDILEAGDLLSGIDNGSSYEEEEDGEEMVDRPLDSKVKCGICYRQGYSPAFETIGYSYQVCTANEISDAVGYEISQSEVPTRLIKNVEEGRVYFEITVPRYFQNCTVSIRDNLDVLSDIPKVDMGQGAQDLTKAFLNSLRGGTLRLFVDVASFTHVSFTFDLGIEPIMCNLSEEANSLDFMTLNTVGNMSVALPYNVGWIKPRDIIHIPSRNLTLKVTDAPKKQLVEQEIWEWLVSTRVLQPQEDLKQLVNGRVIY